jgi:hypothetical protein
MSKGEGQDPLLDMGGQLVGHPGTSTFTWSKRLQAPGQDLPAPPVERGAVHAHDPARLRDVAELTSKREQSHPLPMDDIIERQAAPPSGRLAGRTEDAPLVFGRVGRPADLSAELGVSSP